MVMMHLVFDLIFHFASFILHFLSQPFFVVAVIRAGCTLKLQGKFLHKILNSCHFGAVRPLKRLPSQLQYFNVNSSMDTVSEEKQWTQQCSPVQSYRA